MRLKNTKVGWRLGIAGVFLLAWSGVARAQWTPLSDPFPGHPETCLLQTDGTVMCHEYGTNRWHRLTPDNTGNYVNGTWDVPGTEIASMPDGTDTSVAHATDPVVTGPCAPCTYAPTYFASNVLADGRIVVIGGEFNTNGKTWTNIGFMYTPATDSWSAQLTEPFGTRNIGDAQSVVLPNKTMLLANIGDTNLASYDPATLTFTALNPTGKLDPNDQENWNLLPDGTILTVDSRIASKFEIYNPPPTNTWGGSGPTPVNLADTGAGSGESNEVGPAVLRPDGTMIYFSGNPAGQNAVYNTTTGLWSNTAAMDFPIIGGQQYSVPDGPACLLPNGNVLVQASPPIPGSLHYPFNTPSHFFEFDGTNLTQVADSASAGSLISYQGRMLLLPTGEVLFTGYDQDATDVVQVYSNGLPFQNAWRPVITSGPANVMNGNTYPISGKQFNGLSQGATYGDDAHMSTNYPLVRLTNISTGHVCYARTHDHSTMGLATGNAIVSTMLDGRSCIESGPSNLVVVANGIPSEPIVVNGPDLTIAKTHSPVKFTEGDIGDTFTLTVGNAGQSPTSGVVTVKDTLPPSLTATAISGGPAWACILGTLTCTRADALAAGATYPEQIVITVNVASNAPSPVVNTAVVSGGGEASTANVTGNDTVTDSVVVIPTLKLPSDVHAWVGLSNSNDQGTQFDVRVELLQNGSPVFTGLQRCITGLTRNPTFAKDAVIAWIPTPPVPIASGDVLALRISTRIGTTAANTKCAGPGGSHNNAVGLRLYYDSTSRPSRLDQTIGPDPSKDFYLHSDGAVCPNGDGESPGVTNRFLDGTAPGAPVAKCKQSGVVNFAGGNPFVFVGLLPVPAGTWSQAPLP